jgi:hypothetical protein
LVEGANSGADNQKETLELDLISFKMFWVRFEHSNAGNYHRYLCPQPTRRRGWHTLKIISFKKLSSTKANMLSYQTLLFLFTPAPFRDGQHFAT